MERGRIQGLLHFLSTAVPPVISGTGEAIQTSNYVHAFIGSFNVNVKSKFIQHILLANF